MIKYYLQYNEPNSICNVELEAKTQNGARKLARLLAKQAKIGFYDIVYRCRDGRITNLKGWA